MNIVSFRSYNSLVYCPNHDTVCYSVFELYVFIMNDILEIAALRSVLRFLNHKLIAPIEIHRQLVEVCRSVMRVFGAFASGWCRPNECGQ